MAGQLLDMNCGACGAPLQRWASKVKHSKHVFCNRACQGAWRSTQTGHKAANWRGGSRMSQGRVMLHMPWHHMADQDGYVFRYVIVAELKFRRPLEPGWVVHHEDDDEGNDHPDNLKVFRSQADHARYHGLKRTDEEMAAMRAARGTHDAAG